MNYFIFIRDLLLSKIKEMKKRNKILFCEPGKYTLTKSKKVYVGVKLVLDFLFAVIALILSSPIFLIVAIAIKMDSKGPVFFKHKRIGKDGKEFTCVKFRSMYITAKPNVAGYQNDGLKVYITRVGAFLRKTSLDELPQLFSLLNGKMSLVGYRPSQKCETDLNEARDEFGLSQIRPGITGWAQINGRDALAAKPKLKAKYDGYYLRNMSFFLDVKILFITIFKVLSCSDVAEGCYDIEIELEQNAKAEQSEHKS